MTTELLFKINEIPPSVNALYFYQGGRRHKTSAGNRFVNEFVSTLGGVDKLTFMSFDADPEAKYFLVVWMLLPATDLYNENYGTDKRVKSPYKTFDASNYLKLIEDAISKLIGINDRNNFTVVANKRESPDQVRRAIAHLSRFPKEDPYPCPDLNQIPKPSPPVETPPKSKPLW